ncbi:hypothetical protein JCM3775_006156 [Rhodotorula graminis]|uniref:DNA polymerase kappa n=1 Tax=Rhodotorula graminis (strain WP1) TaxID=578459 RepID=A0A194S1X8_RHOGW|nr:uncharacterized protein RHOBADRAFT_54327 [Rhodotorula graminis WP1]KPV74519.1 hypothetical protein RHOBADRAFT_54327 [Rhodotorula graminis WP1]
MTHPAPPAPQPGPSQPKQSMLKRMGGPSDLKAGVGRGGARTADEIAQITYDESKDSTFFKDQKRRDDAVQVKVERLQGHLERELLTASGDEEARVDAIIAELEQKRDLSRVIALIDADMFYGACHVRKDPSLKGKAFGVGGGMLTTASYEARAYGCRSAMPLFIAKKLCPHIISLTLEPDLYVQASREIFAVLAKYGTIAPASLDEAYVDLTNYCANERVTPTEAITRLRAEVETTTGLTVSAGVSPNKALSKIAADVNKPDGQFVIDPTREACMQFIEKQRLRKCYGIGRVTETLLNGLGLETVGDIFRDRAKLYLVRHHLGQSATFRFLLSLWLGLGSNRVKRAKRGDRKTYGVEKTFHASSNPDKLDDIIRHVAKSLHKDLKRSGFSGRTVTLRIKHANFESVTRAKTQGKNIYVHEYKDLVELGIGLLHKERADRAKAIKEGRPVKGGNNPVLNVRLLGLRVGNLRDERALAKTKKLDGYFTRSPRRTPDNDLQSDSDDADVNREDEFESEDDYDDDDPEADPGKRALNAVIREAALDPFANEGEGEGQGGDNKKDKGDGAAFGGASGSNSGSWMCLDEYDEDADDEAGEVRGRFGVHRKATASTSSTRRRPSPSSSSTVKQGASSPSSNKRRSPSVEDFVGLGGDAHTGKNKKVKREQDEDVKHSSGSNEMTCPVCDKVYTGSVAAMTGHVAQHLVAEDEVEVRTKAKAKVKKERSPVNIFSVAAGSGSRRTKAAVKGEKGRKGKKK